MFEHKLTILESSLRQLRNRFVALASAMGEALIRLQKNELLPGPELGDEISRLRAEFGEMVSTIGALASELQADAHGYAPINDTATLHDVEEALRHLAIANQLLIEQLKEAEKFLESALAILDRLMHLRHVDRERFSPLVVCQDEAKSLRGDILQVKPPKLHEAVQPLIEGSHPLASLLKLAEHAAELDDELCDALHEIVSEAYGSVVAMAALRGRLLVEDSPMLQADGEERTLAQVLGGDPIDVTSSGGEQTQPVEALLVEENSQESLTFAEVVISENITASVDEAIELDTAVEVVEVSTSDAFVEVQSAIGEQAIFIEDASEISASTATELEEEPQEEIGPGIESAFSTDTENAQLDDPWEGSPLEKETTPQEATVASVNLSKTDWTFGPEMLSQDIARTLQGSLDEIQPEHLSYLTWKLISEDRLALAYHFVRLCEDRYVDRIDILPANLLRALILSRFVRFDIGDIAAQLKSDFASVLPTSLIGGDRAWTDGAALLLQAAAMRPSVLAPSSEAWRRLEELSSLGLPELHGARSYKEYCQLVEHFGSQRIPLDFVMVREVKSQEAWQQEMTELHEEVVDWCQQAPRRTMAYDQATKVWQAWQKEKGLINRFMRPVLDNDTGQVEGVRREAKRLSNRDELTQEINYTDRKVLGRHRGEDIGYKALSQLRQNTAQAVQLARRWLELIESQPDPSHNYYHVLVEEFRKSTLRLYPQACDELGEIKSPVTNSPIELSAGAAACDKALQDLQRLLAGDLELSEEEPDPKYLLNYVLLADPAIDMDEDWAPRSSVETVMSGLLRLAAVQDVDWHKAFEMRAEAKDHEGTARIIEYLQHNPTPSIDITSLEEARERYLNEARQTLRRVAAEANRQVEGAVAYGLLREEERAAHVDKIQKIEHDASRVLRVFEKLHEIRAIGQDIQTRRNIQIEAARQRMKAQNITELHPAHERITKVLGDGDLLTAHEYIDMVAQGTPLPEMQLEVDAFLQFFPKGLNEIEHYLEKGGFVERQVIQEIRNYATGAVYRYSFGPIDMYGVFGNQARQVADMLEAWFAMKKSKQLNQEWIRTILDGLGFRLLELERSDGTKRSWMRFQTEEIRSRQQCPVRQYGSGAHGKYRLLCVWDRPTEKELLDEIGDTNRGDPVLVFWFGRMTEARRRDLARVCRDNRRAFIVIDEVLLVYLCGFPPPRLPQMFACTLPFTPLQPYTTTASVVPPEIFYGRRGERDAIVDPFGSCFIYGGRQLGKTALLRDVERNYHDPKTGFVVLWLDLKVEGIGYNRSIDEIWTLLARKFKEEQIIPSSVSIHSSVDTIIGHVENWLNQDKSRRILMLLDEADRFLESDGKTDGAEFQHASRIKGLMDRTNRRFKAVFAGLHNVQRTTRQENHPLAHYGDDAICVGPLLEDGEWREARALIEEPLASIGYRFESPDLVTLILSQTNYYPSLIQLYCSQLLDNVSDPVRAAFDLRNIPPYWITAKHVNDAYQNPALRHSVRQRFDLTLQLDRRYEVMALAVAYNSLATEGHAIVDGFSASWLREEAMYWWPEGFKDSSTYDAIRALADEMVGLGVLRHVSPGTYALRSPNVLLLMGDQDNILRQLDRKREIPIEYEPGVFRSAFRRDDSEQSVDPARRSPLTAQQESELRSRANGVSVILGNIAAGLKDLEPFLSLAFGPEYFILINRARDVTRFAKELAALSNRQNQGTTLVLVTSTCPWTKSWIDRSLETVRRLKSRTSFVRVVFVADPLAAWNLLNETDGQLDSLTGEGVTPIQLSPWHDTALRQWLEDCGFGPRDRDERARITAVTGNWAWLLQRFFQESRSDPTRWEQALNIVDNDLRDAKFTHELLTALGVNRSDTRRVLQAMSDWEAEIMPEDLVELVSDVPAERIHQTLKWADLLSLATPSRNRSWSVNPLVARALHVVEA